MLGIQPEAKNAVKRQALKGDGIESLGACFRKNVERVVPELSRFFGIIIRMFWELGAPHHSAHFHAYYRTKSPSMASTRLN